MTSDDKLEAFDTIDSWCFMFILIIIPYDFILFNRILSVLNELFYIRKVLHPHIKFFVIDSVITLITGTIFRSDFKRLFVTFQTQMLSDIALTATLSVIDPTVGTSCTLVSTYYNYTTANQNTEYNVAIKLCEN
jgi:hypothetical protein